jgi:hypothetical protein
MDDVELVPEMGEALVDVVHLIAKIRRHISCAVSVLSAR